MMEWLTVEAIERIIVVCAILGSAIVLLLLADREGKHDSSVKK